MTLGTIILTDFDKTKKIIKPKAIQKMAVRVPDWNIPHVIKIAVTIKNMRSFLSFVVIVRIMNRMAVDAAFIP